MEKYGDRDVEEMDRIATAIGEAIEGDNIGHIIPALISVLAYMQNDKVMSKDEFIARVAEDLRMIFEAVATSDAQEEKGKAPWLQ